jgi:hypothetical protein
MEIVDRVVIPENLPAGKWVLNWRMDQEESNQIWQSCAGALRSTRISPARGLDGHRHFSVLHAAAGCRYYHCQVSVLQERFVAAP